MISPNLPEIRKAPKQERGRQAVAAIEQACLKILEEEGPRHLTTNRIAEVAGVSIGSLYQYFPNKESIVAAVYAAKLRTEIEALFRRAPIVIGEVANHSLEDGLRAVIQTYVDLRRRLSHLDPEFYGRYHRLFDLLTEANKQAVTHGQLTFDEWFPTLLERHRARLRVADVQLASALTIRTMEGAFWLAVEERPDLLESQAFQEELLALVLGFLEGRPAQAE
jgi:AcrR family transcriptional regulator